MGQAALQGQGELIVTGAALAFQRMLL